MNSTDAIKDKALSMGARVVGVASVEAINRFAPPGYRPDDLLCEGIKSLIDLSLCKDTGSPINLDKAEIILPILFFIALFSSTAFAIQ